MSGTKDGVLDRSEIVYVMTCYFGSILIEEMTGAQPADLLRWTQGGTLDAGQEARLRTGYKVFMMLANHVDAGFAARLMYGMLPQLGDVACLDAIRAGQFRDVTTAVRAYINS